MKILSKIEIFQGGAYKDGPENILVQKWTSQKILEGATQKQNKKDKTTHISGPSL